MKNFNKIILNTILVSLLLTSLNANANNFDMLYFQQLQYQQYQQMMYQQMVYQQYQQIMYQQMMYQQQQRMYPKYGYNTFNPYRRTKIKKTGYSGFCASCVSKSSTFQKSSYTSLDVLTQALNSTYKSDSIGTDKPSDIDKPIVTKDTVLDVISKPIAPVVIRKPIVIAKDIATDGTYIVKDSSFKPATFKTDAIAKDAIDAEAAKAARLHRLGLDSAPIHSTDGIYTVKDSDFKPATFKTDTIAKGDPVIEDVTDDFEVPVKLERQKGFHYSEHPMVSSIPVWITQYPMNIDSAPVNLALKPGTAPVTVWVSKIAILGAKQMWVKPLNEHVPVNK